RLPNGDTLICSGANGTLTEVTPDREMVWKYVNPANGGRGIGAPGGPGGPPQGVQIIPGFVQGMLNLSEDQRKDLDAFHKDLEAKLDKLLTEEQRKSLKEAQSGRGGFAGMPQPGQIMSPFQQARLKLSDDQKKELEGLQKSADAKV